jgi:4-diphosphocytidyl-2-C-methyl-D-erythritol kinase
MTRPIRVTVQAHAKVNLTLRVLGRRPDGYHELQTVFQTVALRDTLVIESTPRRSLTVAGTGLPMPPGPENLVWKAAAAVWEAMGRTGVPEGVRIGIRKRIPSQAGLGGGSSDAAATLVGLNRVWNLRWDYARLAAIGRGLGSDVPFFLLGGTALGLGNGADIYPLAALPTEHILILVPSFGVATAAAYAWLDEDRAARAAANDQSLQGAVVNDFEPTIESRYPAIATLREALLDQGARVARMSGSGSAVFGLFPTANAASRAARRLNDRAERSILTKTIARSADRRALLAQWGSTFSAVLESVSSTCV